MKKFEMDELRLFVHSLRETQLFTTPGEISCELSDVLDSFVVEDSTTELEEEWARFLNSLETEQNNLSNICPDCLGSGKEYYECDIGHYGGKMSCITCCGAGKVKELKNDKE